MPILVARKCSSCGVGYDLTRSGNDIEDVSKVDWEKYSAYADELLTDLFGRRFTFEKDSKPEYTEGALLSVWIEDLAEDARRVPETNSWLVRYAITPVAARLGGRFELRFGKPGSGSPCFVVRVPADVRPGQTLRVAGVCPDGADLLIRLEIRAAEMPDMLAEVMSLCPACHARIDRDAQLEQSRREQQKQIHTQVRVALGVGLVLLLGFLGWVVFG
jgi:hypothetical protein